MEFLQTIDKAPHVSAITMSGLLLSEGFGDSVVAAGRLHGKGMFSLHQPGFNEVVMLTDPNLQRQLYPDMDRQFAGSVVGEVINDATFDTKTPSFLLDNNDSLPLNKKTRAELAPLHSEESDFADRVLEAIIKLTKGTKLNLFKASLVATLAAYDEEPDVLKNYEHYLEEADYNGWVSTLNLISSVVPNAQPLLKLYAARHKSLRQPEKIDGANDRSVLIPGLMFLGSGFYWTMHHYATSTTSAHDNPKDFALEVLRLDATPIVVTPRSHVSVDNPGRRVIPSPYAGLRDPVFGEDVDDFRPSRFEENADRARHLSQIAFGFSHRCAGNLMARATLVQFSELMFAQHDKLEIRATERPRMSPLPPLKVPRSKDIAKLAV
jgi:hypothetical protein